MANWTDQEPYEGEVVVPSLKIGDRFFEIERAYDGTGYRITGGNLFGSQSIHVRSAQNVLHCLGFLSASGVKLPFGIDEIEALPGFIRVEIRG